MPSKEKSQDFSLIPVTHKRKNCHLKENSNHQLGSMPNRAEEVKLINKGNLDGYKYVISCLCFLGQVKLSKLAVVYLAIKAPSRSFKTLFSAQTQHKVT